MGGIISPILEIKQLKSGGFVSCPKSHGRARLHSTASQASWPHDLTPATLLSLGLIWPWTPFFIGKESPRFPALATSMGEYYLGVLRKSTTEWIIKWACHLYTASDNWSIWLLKPRYSLWLITFITSCQLEFTCFNFTRMCELPISYFT